MTITVHHYGAFRKLDAQTALDIPLPVNAAPISEAMFPQLGEQHRLLIEDSALANDTAILPDDYVIAEDCALSVLPPVCGG